MNDSELRALRWNEISLVFQGAMNSLSPVGRIEGQLTDAIAAHRPHWKRQQRTERASELMSLVGIPQDRLSAYPHQLSGGMRQRVMIAMAMALEPDIVIMDEPTTALDVVMQRQILNQIMSLRDRLQFSVIFITHDVSLLIELADRIAILYAGRIIEDAQAGEIFRRPFHPYTNGLLHSFPALHGPRTEIADIPGSPPDLENLPSGCAFHPRCRYRMDQCSQTMPPLTVSRYHPDLIAHTVACHLHLEPGDQPAPPTLR